MPNKAPVPLGMPYLAELSGVEDAVRRCAGLGFSFLELNANFPACLPERLNEAALAAMAGQCGVFFTMHLAEEADPLAFTPQVRQAWLASIAAALRLARALDMPVVNMHLPRGVYISLPGERLYLYQRYETEVRQAALAFRDLCDGALRGSPTRLCIENTAGFLPHEWAIIDLLLESDVFALTLDVGHDHGTGHADRPGYLARQGRLRHMHLHDAAGTRAHLPLGAGEVDIPGELRLAAACGATTVLEVKTLEALSQSQQALARLMEETEHADR